MSEQRRGLKERTIRMTAQRRVILEELCRAPVHPTAAELLAAVRRRLPRVSLATVYRSLDALMRRGLASSVETARGPRRFDGNPAVHHHMECLGCGRVLDAPEGSLPFRPPDRMGDFEVHAVRVEFTGLCAACRKDPAAR